MRDANPSRERRSAKGIMSKTVPKKREIRAAEKWGSKNRSSQTSWLVIIRGS